MMVVCGVTVTKPTASLPCLGRPAPRLIPSLRPHYKLPSFPLTLIGKKGSGGKEG